MKKAIFVNTLGLLILWIVTYVYVSSVAMFPAIMYAAIAAWILCYKTYKTNRAKTMAVSLIFAAAGVIVSASTIPFNFRIDGVLEFALMLVLGAGSTWLPLALFAASAAFVLYSVIEVRRESKLT